MHEQRDCTPHQPDVGEYKELVLFQGNDAGVTVEQDTCHSESGIKENEHTYAVA